ncbi:hypothetical protein ES288_D12G178600v1 [Gossypium darwinii]|uniref:Protein kinase domain-containing protein n=1 Tax=Gossypium darwinii TaxID=34276 RepID=A0A5D2A9B4_GOSDA|nr:hypothetical protein ES288_D12G178600v1 [Gossypium darwinii]
MGMRFTVDLPAGHDSPFTDWNKNDATPCRFPDPRVVGIAVSGKNLRGYIPSELGTLIYLRSLNLHNNNFYGSILGQLFNETLLHSLFLYGNDLSGSLPPLICNLPMLQNLDLSNNSLSGSLPENLKNCKQLQRLILAQNKFSGQIPGGIWPKTKNLLNSLSTTLNLSYNHLSGKLSKTLGDLPVTVSFDLRNNNLSSEIPKTGSFANQGLTTFLNNPLLYGFPLQKPCTNSNISLSGTQSSSRNNLSETQKKGLGPGLILLISAADAAGLDFLRLIIAYIYWKRKDSSNGCSCTGKCKFDSENEEHEKGERSAKGEGELVAIDKWFNIELDELLRASTYVLGKSGLGIVYKMVLGNGVPVAVRRLGEGGLDQQRYREFAAEFYYVANKKISSRNGQPPTNLTCLNKLITTGSDPSSCGGFIGGLPHKSIQTERTNNYRSSEARAIGGRPTQKWDVYSFGVVLLELLIRKSPELSSTTSSSMEIPDLVRWVRKGLEEENPLSDMADSMLLQERLHALKQTLRLDPG